jgi:hypothetical protein
MQRNAIAARATQQRLLRLSTQFDNEVPPMEFKYRQ